jgi:hypothetical protein
MFSVMTHCKELESTNLHFRSVEVDQICEADEKPEIYNAFMKITNNNYCSYNTTVLCSIAINETLLIYRKGGFINEFELPSIEKTQRQCNFHFSLNESIPSLQFDFRCIKVCLPYRPNDDFYHTLEKNCPITVYNNRDLMGAHIITSKIDDVLKNFYVNIGAVGGTGMSKNYLFKYALENIQGKCEITIHKNSLVTFGKYNRGGNVETAFL